MQVVFENVLQAMVTTPLIKLQHIPDCQCADIIVKDEALQVGGSIKTRISYAMIKRAEAEGLLHPDSVIVESTSGNQGVGLALVGAVLGYKVKIIMPDSVSAERRKLCEAYGAEVILIHDEGNIGDCIQSCADMALSLKEADPEHVYIPQQFENPANVAVHETQTGQEILDAMEGRTIDGFVSGVGTGGTLTGVAHALKRANPDMRVWAVEPEKAAILSGKEVGTHIQMGIGDGLIPEILDTQVYDDTFLVSDEQAVEMARRLAREEGLLVGISSGTNVCAALALAKQLGPGHTVVTILPDTAERYFSTPLFRESK